MYFCISCLPQIAGCTGRLVAAGGTPSSSRQLMCCPRRLNPPWAKAFAMARTYFQHGSVHGKVWRKKQPQPQPSWWEAAVGAPSLPFPSRPLPHTGHLCSPSTDAPTAKPWTTRPSQLFSSSFPLTVEVQGLKRKTGEKG